MNIRIRRIKEKTLSEALFTEFNRHQEVTRCFRARGGKWLICDIGFTEEWGENEKKELVRCLANTLKTGGIIYGAFDGNRLVGFMSVEKQRFGSKNQYVELSSLHVDADYRRYGLGKQLFECAVSSASSLGAKKLYISGHSSVESQAFYRKMGCVEALEFNPECLEREPCDCQLEYALERKTNNMALYMCMGLSLGLVFGQTVFDNIGIGMCLGMVFGLAIGTALDVNARKLPGLAADGIAGEGAELGGQADEGTPIPGGQPVAEGNPTRHPDNV